MTVKWDDKLLTGINEIDNQHKEIFKRILNLFDACKKGKGREEVINTFIFLEDYIITHFKAEESILFKYNYPYHISHIAEHKQFISVINELKQDLETHGVTGQFVINTNRKAVQWLLSHICKEDKTLAEFIQKNTK